jgi:hypothetical protein
MTTPKDFTIDRVSWHTQVSGNPETREQVIERFRVIAAFLQNANLTVRPLLRHNSDINEDFAIRRSDLTEEGFKVLQGAYDQWLRKIVNKRKNVNDLSLLETELARIRGKK